MALERLKADDLVYRFYLLRKDAVADISAITEDELNANPTNDPDGRVWNLTCVLDVDNSQFDLDDPSLDDSLTFCQKAGSGDVINRSATVVFAFNEAKERWLNGSSKLAADGFNTATLAKSLLMWRGIDYYALLSIGKKNSEAFESGDRYKLVEVSTDVAIPSIATGSMILHTQTFAKRTDIAWNMEVVA